MHCGEDDVDAFISVGELSACFIDPIAIDEFLFAANDWIISRVAGSTIPPFKAAIAVAIAIGC